MNSQKLTKWLATVCTVACVLSTLSSAAPSVKGQYGQSSGRWNDDLTDQQESGFEPQIAPYENAGSDATYQEVDEYGGGDRQLQRETDRVNYAPHNAYDDDSDEDSSWGESWNALTDWGANVAENVARGAREFGSGVANTAAGLWNKVDDTFDGVWDHFTSALQHLGNTIQQGASYCAHVLQQKADDVRSSEFLQKLEDKVEQGNDQVMEFFQVLGEKIERWAEEHADDSVDDGFEDSELYQQGAGRYEQFEREGFPDFFQDAEVQGEIEKLVDYGVIQQEEADLFVQQRRQ